MHFVSLKEGDHLSKLGKGCLQMNKQIHSEARLALAGQAQVKPLPVTPFPYGWVPI